MSSERIMRVLSDVVADQVKKHREAQGLYRDDLAKRCAELGWPALTSGVIGTIETGRPDKDGKRRREISIDELVVLARALDVEPVLLVAPLGHLPEIEILPGQTVPAVQAYRWLTGDSALDTISGQPAHVIRTYLAYQRAAMDWVLADRSGNEREAKAAMGRIQALHRTMAEAGWLIPPLPSPDSEDES